MKKIQPSFSLSQNHGFTMVELMVVVAIIGILTAIALPQYQKFQSKARQTEAKINLGAMYTAEQAFSAENGSFTACVGAIGYQPDASIHYYAMGLANAGGACGPGGGGGTACTFISWTNNAGVVTGNGNQCAAPGNPGGTAIGGYQWAATGVVFKGAAPAAVGSIPAAATVSGTNFTFGAAGQISSGNVNLDTWTINDTKQLVNTQPIL